MMICDVPNYAEAQKIAYETIQNSTQKKLPISIKKIIRSFPNLYLQKYSTFAKQRELSFDDVILFTNSEEGCLWMKGDGNYLILYNDQMNNSGRIRFTLAHELGHYLLKHNEKSKKTLLPRNGLSDKEYDFFEKEANYFARRLLAPIPLVDLYVSNWQRIKAPCIEFAFDTSYTVANYVINDLNRRYQKANIVCESHPMVDYFADFVNTDASSQICHNCFSIQSIKNINCVFCGESDFIKASPDNYPEYYIMKGKKMNYSKIETNENGTPFNCPICDYENLEDDHNYCPMCATFIHNVCLGGEDNRFEGDHNDYRTLSIKERYYSEKSCSGYLNGGYRFCPHCGSTTSYSEQSLLLSWKEEKNNNSNIFDDKRFTELPF